MLDLRRFTVPAALAVAALLALRAAASDGAENAPPPPWSAANVALRFPDPDAGADPGGFVGTARCRECHHDRHESLGTSFHASILSGTAKGARGCETCHGPGRAHADSGGGDVLRHPLDVPPREVIGVCVRCHASVLTKPVRGHRAWIAARSADGDARPCTQCHEIHVDRGRPEFAAETGPFVDVAALAKAARPIPGKRCILCHAGFHPEMRRSGHAALIREGEQCGTCHGAGSLHEASGGRARLIVNPARQRRKASNAGCNRCHASGAQVQRWTCAEHAREGTGCVTCHDPNAARGHTLRGSEFDLCGGCHEDVRARFRLPNRHDVARGRVRCSDCHDPHANRSRVRDRDVRQRSCEECHAEKAGPFLHDHGIKRTEGCVACHDPHGSVNRRMLSFARIKPLCLQCHAETAHDLGKRRYDNCISCHVEIHGSDIDRLLLR